MSNIIWLKPDADILKYETNDSYKFNLKCSGNISSDFSAFADYFFQAAEKVTEYILDRGYIGELDCNFFALAYLYRHSLELKLKAVAFKYITAESRKAFIRDTFHNLIEILKYITPYVSREIEYDIGAYQWLKMLLQDMEPIDKASDAFRYPFKIAVKNNKVEHIKQYSIKPFFEGQKHINLIAFADKMELSFEILCSYYCNEKKKFDSYNNYTTIFLEEGGEYYAQSVIGYNYKTDFYGPIIKGYWESAKYLGNLITNTPSLKNVYFFPMCYLYRNALELQLKQIWFEECAASFQERCKKLSETKHSLLKLWNIIYEDVCHHSQNEEDQSVISYAENYITQIHALDSSSSVFRYPVDKETNYHFKKNKYLDAKNVNQYFDSLSTFLGALETMMTNHNQNQADMQAEYTGYF